MITCELHQREIVIYCQDCSRLLCIRCVPPHSNHAIGQLDEFQDFAESIITHAKSNLQAKRDQLTSFRKQFDDFNELQVNANSRLDANLLRIERDKRRKLAEIKKEMETQLQKFYMQTDSVLEGLSRSNAVIEAIERQRDVRLKRIESVENQLRAGGDIQAILTQMKELRRLPELSNPPAVPVVPLIKPEPRLKVEWEGNWSVEERRLYGLR